MLDLRAAPKALDMTDKHDSRAPRPALGTLAIHGGQAVDPSTGAVMVPIYATGIDLEKTEGTPIGVNCRLCERENCSQRAEPPITRTLILDENTRRVSSFAFSNAREL